MTLSHKHMDDVIMQSHALHHPINTRITSSRCCTRDIMAISRVTPSCVCQVPPLLTHAPVQLLDCIPIGPMVAAAGEFWGREVRSVDVEEGEE